MMTLDKVLHLYTTSHAMQLTILHEIDEMENLFNLWIGTSKNLVAVGDTWQNTGEIFQHECAWMCTTSCADQIQRFITLAWHLEVS